MSKNKKMVVKVGEYECQEVWSLYLKYLPKFLSQEENLIDACLFACFQACSEYYQEIPTEKEIRKFSDPVARKFNFFSSIVLKELQKFLFLRSS